MDYEHPHRGHALMPTSVRDALPPLYANETKKPEDIPVIVKYFATGSAWTWYITEGSPEVDDDGREVDMTLFGYVVGFEGELGIVSLRELASLMRGPMPIVERDLYYGAHTLAEVMRGCP